MVLKLYGTTYSTTTKLVLLVLHEKKIPFEFVDIDFLGKREHKSPAYLEKQPWGQVPYLEDDGFILYESRAIARYLEEKYPGQGPTLIPKDPKQKALFEQAASIEYGNFDPHILGAVVESVMKPLIFGLPLNQQKFQSHVDTLASKLDIYDKILSKQRYLSGEEVTLADLFHLPWAALFPLTGSKVIDERPNVTRWLKDLMERESWQAVKEPAMPPL